MTLGPDQIGVVKTAVGITTRISFPEPVQEAICGDLYDPATGKGSFVIQLSGSPERRGNDVFLKPVTTKGMSNMFVKTGDGKRTYNFDLKIVDAAQAHRVVNVLDAPDANPHGAADSSSGSPHADGKAAGSVDVERIKADAEQQARVRADEIIRNARQQADRIIGEAESKAQETERQLAQRADQEADHRFMQSLMLGIRESRINNPRATAKGVTIMVDPPRVLSFNDKAFIRYVIQNSGELDFSFEAVTLETGAGQNLRPITVEITQSKAENKLATGESLTGILAFDPKQLAAKDKLVLYVRGEGGAEIVRVTIQ